MALIEERQISQKALKVSSTDLKFVNYISWVIKSNQLLGFFPYSFTNGTIKFKLVSIPLMLALIQIVAFCFWPFYSIKYSSNKALPIFGFGSSTEAFVYNLQTITNSIVAILLRLEPFLQSKKMIQFWENTDKLFFNLQALDSNKFLPVQLNHLYTYSRFHVITLFVTAIALVLPMVILAKKNNIPIEGVVLPSLTLEFVANTISYFMISNACFCVTYITFFRICFTFLRTQLENEIGCTEFINSQEKWKMLLWKTASNENENCTTFIYSYNSEKIGKIMEILESLEMHVEEFNLTWSWKMILSIMHCILSLLLTGFFACLWIGRGLYVMLLVIGWSWLLNTVVLYTITAEGEKMKEEAKKFALLFNILKLSGKMSNIDKMLKEMGEFKLLKLLTNPPTISPSKYFEINRSLLTSICGSLMTYLIVLLQFQGNVNNTSNATNSYKQNITIPN